MQTYIKKLIFALPALLESSSPSFLVMRCCHRPILWTHNSTRWRVSTLSSKIPLVSKSLIITTLLEILGANRAEDYLQNAVNQAFSDQN